MNDHPLLLSQVVSISTVQYSTSRIGLDSEQPFVQLLLAPCIITTRTSNNKQPRSSSGVLLSSACNYYGIQKARQGIQRRAASTSIKVAPPTTTTATTTFALILFGASGAEQSRADKGSNGDEIRQFL
jgi:hypothetical protein